MKLQDKVAVVTGAGSGMGKAIATLYAQEGAKVVVSDINEESAQAVVNDIKARGGEAIVVLANVAKEEDVQNLIDTTVSTYGTVDILVNNAGIMDGMEPAADVTDEKWERLFAVNTTSVMRTTRKVLPIFLEKQKGIIVNIASAGAYTADVQGQPIRRPNMRLWASPKIQAICMLSKAFAVMQSLQALWQPISALP